MGLDLYMETKTDYDNDVYNDSTELVYGRKTWALYDYFATRCPSIEDDWLFEVPRKVWDEFVATFSPYKTLLEECNLILTDLECYENDIPQERYIELYTKTMKLISDILDTNLNESYTLGADWEARALCKWLNADFEISQLYLSGETIYLVASY